MTGGLTGYLDQFDAYMAELEVLETISSRTAEKIYSPEKFTGNWGICNQVQNA